MPCLDHRFPPLVIAAALTAACAARPPEQQIVEDAASALGGRNRILAVRTLAFEAEGQHFNLGQDMTPEALEQTFSVRISREMDLEGRRARTVQTRAPNFTYFQGPAPQTRTLGIDGPVGYDLAAGGAATRLPEGASRDRAADLYHHPIAAVRAALDPSARLENARVLGGERIVGIVTAAGVELTLAIDAATSLPTRVASLSGHAVLGDLGVETAFHDYREVDGIQMPGRLTAKADAWTTGELLIGRQAVNGEVGDLSAPAGLPSDAPPPPPSVTVEEVARGVWLLAGQSHHSMVVEFADHLVLFEAPSEARTLAVIARARELRPDKPLTRLVTSHHHFDHAGGIRAAVSEGLAVVTHEANAAFVRSLVERSRTVAPDALTRSPRPLTLETVGDEKVLDDGTMTMRLFHIAGNPHAGTLLMAYLPRERLLLQADAYSPGGSYHPYARNLLDNIRRRNLRVDRIVPVHGAVVPLAELVRAVQAGATN